MEVEIVFSSPLPADQVTLLNSLVGIAFDDNIPGISCFVLNPQEFNRRSFRVTSTPTVDHDIRSGYVVGSEVITDAGAIYICTDNTTGAAI